MIPRTLALALGATVFLSAPEPVIAQTADGPLIARVDFAGDVSSEQELRLLLSLKPGDVYTASKVRDALAIFYQTGNFERIAVTEERRADGVALMFTFVRQVIVTGWEFQGNQHLNYETLTRALVLSWGQALNPGQFEGYARTIRDRYAREGYPKATASFAVIPTRTGEARLVVTVKEGEPVKLQKLGVLKSGSLDPNVILAKFGMKQGDVLKREKFFQGIENLETLLSTSGYLNSRVGYYFEMPDGTRQSNLTTVLETAPPNLSLVLAIEEGQKAVVAVESETLLPVREMGKAVTVYKNRSYSPFELESSAEALRQLYVSRGYPQAKVTHTIAKTESEHDTYAITFLVDPGDKTEVSAIDFEGNAALDDGTLLRAFSTRPAGRIFGGGPFDPEAWEADLENLEAFYEARGFLTAKVTGVERSIDAESGKIKLLVRVQEGPQTVVARLRFKGVNASQEAGLLQALPVNPGDPFTPKHIADYIASVQAYFAKTGYPLAKVEAGYDAETKTPNAAKEEGTLVISVVPGARKRIGRIVLRGNVKTHDPVIRRQLTVEPGQSYNAEELFLTQQQIYQLGFFDRVNVEPIRAITPLADDPIDLVVEVHERETGWVAFGGGYGDLQGPQASAEYQQNNLFGTGRPLRLEGIFSARKSSGVFTLRDPYLLNTDFIGETGFAYLREKPDPSYEVQTYGPSVGLSRQISDRLLGSMRYSWSKTNYVTDAAGTLPVIVQVLGGATDRTNSILTAGLTYDTRSDLTNPRWGSRADLSVDLATPFLGGTLLYTRPRLNLGHFIPFPRRVVLALGGEAGYIQTLNAGQLPDDLRFRAGGGTSVRGYGYNELAIPTGRIDPATGDEIQAGGLLLLVTHAEVRFPISGDFGGVVFVDAGNVLASPDMFSFSDIKLTTGLGVRYQTPVGPIRVDYAVRVRPTFSLGESLLDNLTFGLGQAF